MARGDTAQAKINVTTNAQAAKNDIEDINNLLKKLQKTKQMMMKEGLHLTADGKETATFKKLNRDIKDAQQSLKRMVDSQTLMNKTMDNLKDIRLKELKRRYRELTKELGNFTGREKQASKQWRDNLEKIKAQISAIEGAGKGASKSFMSFGGSLKTTMKNLVAYAGVFAMFNRTKEKLSEIVKLNKEFSDQLANIRKVSNLPMDSINELATNLAKIDTRSSVQQLNELAYTGAKLGFGTLGTDALEGFVKSAVVVQNALSEDMGADAMTALSKMVEVMGLIPKLGVEKAMNSVGSAIFKLASTSTATGTNIVEFSKRLMGLANQAGITADELLAIGSAADSMALMPEVAATAFNKLITSVQKQPNLIENALHIEPGTISQMYQAGKMTDALVLIFDKMREKGGMNALMQSGVFKDLGSDGARLVAVMATMSNRVDMLKEHLETARDAFAEGTAVGQEYAIQMETAEAYSERAANMWTKAFVNSEGVNVVKSLTKAWYDMTVQLTQSESVMTSVKLLLEGLVNVFKVFISILPGLLTSLAAFSGIKGLMMVYNSLFAVEGMTIRTMLSLRGLGLMMKTNWVGWVVTAIGVLGQFVFSLAAAKDKMDEARGAMPGFKRDLSDLNVAFGAAASEAGRFRDAILAAEKGTKERAAAIRNFKQQYGQYLSQMITEESSAYAIAKAYNEVTKALRAKIALQMKEEDISSQVAPREGWAAQRREEYNKYMGQSQYNGAWLTGVVNDALAKGTSIKDLAKQLNEKAFHLSDEIVENALRQSASGTYKDIKGVTTENGDIFRQLNGQNLWRALRYATQSYSANTALNRVNAKWKPEQDLINETLAKQGEKEVMDPLLDAPDKAAARAARKAAQDHKQAIRKELQDAKQESDAIIAKIEEWYRLQETVVTGFAADGKWTQQQAEMVNRELEAAKNEALANARLAISGRDTQTWEQTKESLRVMMFDTGKWSQELFQQMMDVSMDSIRQNLSRIDQEGGQYGITTSSLKDGLDKNAAGNRRKVQELRNKTAKEVEKALLKYNYYEQAARAYEDRLTQLGLLTETAEQAAKRLNGLKASTKTEEQLTRDRSTARRQAGDQFRKNPAASYSVDVESTESLHSWLQGITGAQGGIGTGGFEWQFSGWAKAFEDDFGKWLTDSETYKEDIQAFYLTLADYDRQYYDAVGQHRDKMVKDAKTRWETSDEGRLYSSAEKELGWESRERKMYGQDQGTNFGQMAGFYNINDDPEIQMSLLRMAQYETELQAFKEENEAKKLEGAALDAYQQELFEREQQRQELERQAQESIMQHINDHIQRLSQWTAPIEQFATDVGDAMGQAIVSGESMSEAMQNALKSLVQSWGQSTIQIVKELMMQQLKQKLIGKTMVKQEKQTQESLSQSDEEGGEKRLKATNIVETGMASVMQTMGQQILAQKQTQDQAEMSSEATKTTGTVMAGIAQGAAKIIGTLGPWGAPLIAVITALLMGLLSAALGALFGGSSSANNNNAAAKPKIKIAQGMLTYNEGNVQTVVGDDGRVYRAREQRSLPEGVSMVTEPIATRVNGQQALVGERGPEIVIGRKTTRAIQMNRPDLLRDLALIDRGITTRKVRTFDEGNISDMATAFAGQLPATQQSADGQQGGGDAQRERDQAMLATLGVLSQTIGQLQQQLAAGIHAEMNMFGDNGAYKKFQQADKFYKRYGG